MLQIKCKLHAHDSSLVKKKQHKTKHKSDVIEFSIQRESKQHYVTWQHIKGSEANQVPAGTSTSLPVLENGHAGVAVTDN